MFSLCLTLGHNSSAILIEDGKIVIGYEEERLTKVKSESRFPRLSIEQIEKFYNLPDDIDIYVSHWFIGCELPFVPNKWWDGEYIKAHFPNAKIITLSPEFSHHDAHCHSAMAFCAADMSCNETLVVVADGFGNFGETLSIYKLDTHRNPHLEHRSFGFFTSLGLMYQYATAYLEMKENQDEYKLLGYESKINDIGLSDSQFAIINEAIGAHSLKHLESIFDPDVVDIFDPVLSITALPQIRLYYQRVFGSLMHSIGINDRSTDLEKIRVIIAYYVQRRLEAIMASIIKEYNPNHLILVGGIFMNVKLNNFLSSIVPGKTSIMPLSGDQGAAIGIYHAVNQDFMWPGHLMWGRREIMRFKDRNIGPDMDPLTAHLYVYIDKDFVVKKIIELLENDKIVNLVGPDMEFGARALGGTSTLALPSTDNAKYINTCNNRTTIMPFAPVIRKEDVNEYFEDADQIVNSLEYMICTRFYRPGYGPSGCSHPMPLSRSLTGRPQVVSSGHILHDILSGLDSSDLLIQTSFNPHGRPILYSEEDIYYGHMFMKERDIDDRIVTIVYEPRLLDE